MFKCVLTHIDTTGATISSIELTNEARNLPDKIAESLQDARYERSEQYNGIIRSIGVKLTFVGTGADFLKQVFDVYGAGAIVNISIYYAVNGIDFNEVFTGKVDLKSYSYSYKDTTVECQLINGDVEDRIINGIEQKQAFTPSTLVWTPTLFRKRNTHIVADTLSGSSGYVYSVNRNLIIPKSIKSTGSSRLINIIDWINQDVTGLTIDEIKEMVYPYYHFQCNATADYTAQIVTRYQCSGSFTANTNLIRVIFDKYDNLVSATNISALGDFVAPVPVTKTYNISLTLTEGQKIAFFYYIEGENTDPNGDKIGWSYFNVNFEIDEYRPDSTHPTIQAFTLLNKLIERLTGASNLLQSFLLNDYTASERYRYTMLTSGKCIRTPYSAFSGSLPVLSVSLADVIQALRVPFAIGMGIEGSGAIKRVVIDSVCKFYKPEVVVNLGEVREFTEEFDMTQAYNSVVIDYPDNSKEDDADNFEFIGKTEYITPLNYVKNELTLKTDAIVDGNTIELTRQKPITDTSTDADSNDEALFMVNCFDDSGTITTTRGENITAFDSTSVPDNTFLYNLELWQPMVLRNWASWLLSGMKYRLGDATSELTNAKTAANKTFNIALNISGSVVTLGNDDPILISKLRQMGKAVPIANGKDAIFEPVLYNFKAYFTAEQLKQYENNRHGTMQFSYLGETFYGYAMKVPAIPYVETDFTLLKLSNYAKSLL